MRQGGYLVTRGLTGSATNMIIRGLIPIIEDIIESEGGRIVGRRPKRRYFDDDLRKYLDEYTIIAELAEINGKDPLEPIINKINKTFNNEDLKITVTPEKLVIKSPEIKIDVELIRSKYVKN